MFHLAIKAISWRIVATLTTALIAYLVTGDLGVSISIGGAEALVKIGLFMLHEQAWLRLKTKNGYEVNGHVSTDTISP